MKTKVSILITAGILSLTACNTNEIQEKDEKSVKVQTIQVKNEDISVPIRTSGKLYAESELKLGFTTGGIIQRVYVEEGQSVKKGQLLAQLDLSEIQSQVMQTRLALEKAKRDYSRAKNLYGDSVATLEQLQNSQTALEYAESNNTIANFNLQHSRIVAPSDGKILKLLAEQNEISGPGYPVLLFGSIEDAYIIRINVTDKDIFKIMPNDRADIEFDAYPNKHFEAFVSEIGRAADPFTGTFEVELKLKDPKVELASGLISYVELRPSKKETLALIPIDAVISGTGNTAFVYALSEDNKVIKLKLKVNEITDEHVLAYTEGMTYEKIIIAGQEKIRPGDKVEPGVDLYASKLNNKDN